MNDHSESNLQRDIDRLVSGEATKEQMRQLVTKLGSVPDGWKLCAVAYMEAASWKRTFSAMQPASPVSPISVATQSKQPQRSRYAAAIGAVAVAFIAGVGAASLGQHFAGRTHSPIQNLVMTALPIGATSRQPIAAAGQEPQLLGIVNISNGEETEAAFPLVSTPDKELVAIEVTSGNLDEYNRQLWERKGYRIEQHRKVVNVMLADGHRFQFPIDWVQRRYVGERIY